MWLSGKKNEKQPELYFPFPNLQIPIAQIIDKLFQDSSNAQINSLYLVQITPK